MPKYKIGESVFNIEDSRVDEFLNIAKENNDTPELIEDTAVVDPGKKKTPKKDGATAESANIAPDTDSYSGIGSLEYGKQTTIGKATEDKVELERPFASIDGVPYTFTELEAASAKYNLSLNSYLRKFQLDRTTTGGKRVEIYSDPEILDEVVVVGEDKSKKRKSERKLFDFINKKALVNSTDPELLKDTRAKVYFGYTKNDVPAGGILALSDIKDELKDKFPLFQEYLKTGSFTLPNFNQDEAISQGAQELIKSNIFEEELGKLPESLQSNLKVYFNEKSSFKNKEEIDSYANIAAGNIENRANFVEQSRKNIEQSSGYKKFISDLAEVDSQIKMRLMQFKDRNANENTVTALKQLNSQRENILKNNSDILSDIDALDVLQQRNIKEFNNLNNKLKKEFKNISLSDIFNSKADLDYRPTSRVLNSFNSAIIGGGAGFSELLLDIVSSPLPDDAKEALLPTKKFLVGIQKDVEKTSAQIPEAKNILDKVLDNSASIGLSLVGGAAVGVSSLGAGSKLYNSAKIAEKITLGSFFVTTAGSEYGQTRRAQENASIIIDNLRGRLTQSGIPLDERKNIEREISRQNELKNMPGFAVGVAALAKGSAEVLFEKIQLDFLGKTLASNLFNLQLKNVIKEAPKYLKIGAKSAIVNNAQEFLTLVSNNTIDNATELFGYTNKNYKSLIDGVNADFFAVNTITGAVTAGAASVPSVINSLAQVSKTSRNKKLFDELALKYKSLEDKLNSDLDSNERQDILDEQLNIAARASVYNLELASKLDDYTFDQITELFDLHAEVEALNEKMFRFSQSGAKYKESENQFNEFNAELKRLEDAKNKILDQQNEETGVEIPTDISSEQSFLIAQINLGIRTAKLKHGKENVLLISDPANAEAQVKEFYKGIEEDPVVLSEIIEGINSGKNAVFYSGKMISNYSVVVGKVLKDKMPSLDAQTGAISMFHEMLHSYSTSTYSDLNTNEGRKALGLAIDEIKNNLTNNKNNGSLSEENYNAVISRIETNTKGLNTTLVYEETMNALEEMVRLGYIKRSDLQNNSFEVKNLIDMLRAKAFGALGVSSKLSGSTANDIIYHLKSFQKFTEDTKLLSPPTNEETAEVMFSQGEAAYRGRIDALEEKLLNGEIDYDAYDAQMSAIEDEIASAKKAEVKPKTQGARIQEGQQKLNDKVNALVGPKNDKGKYTITQEEWKKRGIDKAYKEIIQGRLIDPLITRGIVGETIYGKPIEQFIEDVKMGVSDLLMRFNPEQNDSLIGFINSQLNYRKGDVLKKYKKEAGTDSIDIEAGEVGSLKELESQEDAEFEIFKAEELAQEKEEKKKPKLSTTVSLKNEVLQKIDNSLVKAIAVNIKKFDQEISKNRTVTPFVADLKKDLADLLEDTFTSYIREYGFEKFLADYREVFLLNMPTTFLSKHPIFRKVIQKRVNGKWLSPTKVAKEKYDWVDEKGNKLKIDRDNAAEGRGLTSGPEFIKRNADAVNILTENEFVDYHFMDGAARRLAKRNPLSSMARQMASEIAFEILQKDLIEGGKLTEEIATRADLTGLLITENQIENLNKDLDRGLIKFSSAEITIDQALNLVGADFLNLQNFYSNVYLDGLLPDVAFDEAFGMTINNNNIPKNVVKAFRANLNHRVRIINKKIKDDGRFKKNLQSNIENFTLQTLVSIEDTSLKSLLPYTFRLNAENYFNTTVNNIKILFDFYKLNNAQISEEAFINALTAIGSGLTNKTSKAFKNNKDLFKYLKDQFISIIQTEIDKKELIKAQLKINRKNEITYKGKKIDQRRQNKYYPQEARGELQLNADKFIIGDINLQEFKDSSEIADRNEQAEFSRDRLIEILVHYRNLYNKDLIPGSQVYTLFQLLKNGMNSLLKTSYELEFIAYIEGENEIKTPVYEHNKPADELAKNIFKIFFNENITIEQFESGIQNLFEDASAIITDKRIDDELTLAGLRKNTLLGLRYSNAIILKRFPNMRIMSLKTGEVYGVEKIKELKFSQGEDIGTSNYFNEMLERVKGITASETVSAVTARLAGRSKGKFTIFVPPSAEDFEGLLYQFMGSGEQGNIDRVFFEEKLLIPIAEGNYQLNYERQLLKKKYSLLLKSNKGILKKLREESNYKFYTIDSAVRVYIWDKLRFDIPGLYDKDIIELVKIVEADPALKKFADQMVRFPRKQESWQAPKENWAASTLEYDLQQILDKVGRKRIFAKFIENKKIIFSEENLNKIEAAYGTNFRSAMEDMLYRIENGKARELGKDKIANAYMNWVRGSVAVTMFLNTRSALLQQLSMVNFSNWEENNPLAQAKAFANTKQWASDWAMLWNSDWMKERREGLKTDINESELVTAMESSKDKSKALLSWVLTQGFSLTKYGDNFAIATGGAAYYRNRVNLYIEQGLGQAEAEKKAFLDFQEIAERTQQSSRQDLLSNQQVSVAGRLFLAFQNTPMQMTRLTKKALLDLVNNRGSKKANISKILYYAAIQNMIFAFFQNALFAIAGLDDEEEDEKLIDSKTERAINNILDSVLRGSGIAGGTIATIKNVLIQVKKQEEAGWKGDGAYILLEAANVAPPVGIKARRFYGTYKNYKINKNIIDKVPYSNLNHPLYGIAGSLSGAAFNVPLDRLISKANNVVEASNSDHEAWQRIALFLGYTPYDLGIKDDELARIRAQVKEEKKKSRKKIGDGKSFRANPVRVKPKRVN